MQLLGVQSIYIFSLFVSFMTNWIKSYFLFISYSFLPFTTIHIFVLNKSNGVPSEVEGHHRYRNRDQLPDCYTACSMKALVQILKVITFS